MASPLNIALAQIDILWENPTGNMHKLESLLSGVKDADLILLPEMWSTGFTMHTSEASENNRGPAFQWMAGTAAKMNAHVAGSVSTRDQAGYYNRFYCISPDGQVWQYDKKHLFSYGNENQYYLAGEQRTHFEIRGWKVMPIVCYDLRFPTWCRNTEDYDLLVVVANWPTARIHHWDTLLQARAIENQAFVAAVNRVGRDGEGIDYEGHSAVYDMNGLPVLELPNEESMGQVSLEKETLKQFRERYRFLQDRD